MKAAYIYDREDSQGPWVLLCEKCIPEGNEIHSTTPEAGEWAYLDGDPFWRCACCGVSPADEE